MGRLAFLLLLVLGCSPTDDTDFLPNQIHLNLQGGAPPSPLGAMVTATPCDEIVAIAVAEKDRGPSQVGQDLAAYPYKLGNYLGLGEAWCSEFVAWVYRAAGHPFTGGSEQGGWMLKDSVSIRSWFQGNATFISKGSASWSSFTPQPGDYIRYNTSGGGHSGMVRAAARRSAALTLA